MENYRILRMARDRADTILHGIPQNVTEKGIKQRADNIGRTFEQVEDIYRRDSATSTQLRWASEAMFKAYDKLNVFRHLEGVRCSKRWQHNVAFLYWRYVVVRNLNPKLGGKLPFCEGQVEALRALTEERARAS